MTDDPVLAAQLEQERQQRIREMSERLERSGFPPRLTGATLKDFETPDAGRAKALERAIAYADLFRDRRNLPASCMLLCGKPGTGKSHLAVGIARRAAA
jgi:DNA replication protein DnaC